MQYGIRMKLLAMAVIGLGLSSPCVYAVGDHDAQPTAESVTGQPAARAATAEPGATEAGAQSNMQSNTQSNSGNNMQAATQDGKTAGDAFLATNKGKDGVVTLKSGLQYRIIKQGSADPSQKPMDNDVVTVNYEGRLIDGTEFDSSYKRGEPASFPVNGVIKGWTEALKAMPVGSVWELYIPADLAYGSVGVPGVIGPNQTLIFKVELLGINNKK